MLNFILLTKEETENFNKIITKDIKDSFKFSQKDEPINIKNKKIRICIFELIKAGLSCFYYNFNNAKVLLSLSVYIFN